MKGMQAVLDKMWTQFLVWSTQPDEDKSKNVFTPDSKGSLVTDDGCTPGMFSSRNLKIEIPRFNGEDAEGWVFSIQEFFEIYATPLDQRLKLASVHLDGPARDWYMWVKLNKTVHTYSEFITGLLAQFEKLSTKVTGLTEDLLVSMFVGGLKGYIQTEVVLGQPSTYMEVVSLANYPPSNASPVTSKVSTPATSGTKGSVSESSTSSPLHKRLSAAEIKAKRARGECYYCPEKYSKAHKCKASFSLLLGHEELDELMGGSTSDDVIPENTVELEKEESIITPEISFNALEGQFHPSTLRVTGSYMGHQILVLIDNGSTHNFIKSDVANRLKLPLVDITPFRVQIGSGVFLLCSAKCSDVPLKLQDHEVIVDLLVLDIKGSDVVLGVQWLIELGDVMTNHKELTLTFQTPTGVTKLHGEKLLVTEPINGKVVKKLAKANSISCLFSMQVLTKPTDQTQQDLPVPVRQLLHEYSCVFAVPKGLPPPRAIDHKIELLHRAKPVSVRPYSKGFREHIFHLRQVLRTLQHHSLFAKQSNCSFCTTAVEYLGHIIRKDGVHVDSKKIAAMVDWPTPINVRQLRGFLGLTGYYRKFITCYASIAHPLTELLKRNRFKCHEVADQAFQQLKLCMTRAPVLALPNFSLPFVVDTDASNTGIGAVLTQNGHPVAFFSKKLCHKLSNASTYVRELYAITQAVAKWQHYLLGRKFTVRTDHKSLRELMRQTGKGKCYGRCFIKKGGIDGCRIEWGRVVVYGRRRAVIPEDDTALKQKILTLFHASPISGHGRVTKTFKSVSELFYWRNLRKEVEIFVSECLVCQQVKPLTCKKQGLLQPIPVPIKPWREVTMDFITNLPSSSGFSIIMVVVDKFTKVAHFAALKSGYTASKVAARFVEVVVKLHGFPSRIISDRDSIFLSQFWKNLMDFNGTKLAYRTAYHPETDGQTEVVNRCLEQYLRSFTSDFPHKWYNFLPWAELWYNSTFHSAIGMSPYKALYGVATSPLPGYDSGSCVVESVDELLQERLRIQETLKFNLSKAQARMKKQADKKRQDREFTIGDYVLIKFHHYKQSSATNRLNYKLSKRFFGPYFIEQCVGKVAYKLKLPDGCKISLLEKQHLLTAKSVTKQ
ncbi:Transposon Ty3-G Gag-Pol polyprotein [Senna tora]|uniref:Transposon Ty3-G Gag-Pol polyprotein n=1 Tax=Senna tora TaxID=362788 RepID=A0A834XDZ6_9FABA|nr:Transposon Ty3-G Gag-Pol polyprotein [Senna tora]